MTERLVAIGSNSFSGAWFVRQALLEGIEVTGISRSPEPAVPFLSYRWLPADVQSSFEFHQLDLNRDMEEIASTIARVRPQRVVSFAAQSMVAQSWDHPDHWYQTNVVANVQLHDRLRNMPFLETYVHVSTPEVYGNCEGRVTEDAPMNPSTPYAASRAACDMHLVTFHRNYGFPVVFTRAANVFGPGQQLYRIVPRTILYARLGKTLQLHGGGRSVRSFIHVRDVAAGTLKVAEQGLPPEVFHLATERYVSIRELVALTCQRMNVGFDDLVELVEDRPGKDAGYLLDCTRARERLGWEASVELEAGIDETIHWIDDNLEELKKQPMEYVHKP